MASVILNPLAEVGIGMFVTIEIGAGKLMVDFEGHRKRRHDEQHASEEQGDEPMRL